MASHQAMPCFPSRRAFFRSIRQGLVYSILRRRWKEVLALMVMGLVLGLFFRLNEMAIVVWALGTLIIGVFCGTGVFANKPVEKDASPGASRKSPVAVWLINTGFWFVLAIVISGSLFLIFLLRLQRSEVGRQLPWTRVLTTPIWDLRSIGLHLTMWVMIGFSIGQFFAMACRKMAIATFLSLFISLGAALLWVPSLAAGDIHVWQVFSCPVILLSATWVNMRPWMTGQLASRRAPLRLIAFGLLAVLCLAGCLWYRVAEIPDVGRPFDVDGFQTEIALLDRNKAPRAIKAAVRELKAWEKGLTEYHETKVTSREVEETATILAGVVAQAGPNGMMVIAPAPFICRDQTKRDSPVIMPPRLGQGIIRHNFLQRGWQTNDKESAWALDLLFSSPWIEHLRLSVELPPGVFLDQGPNAPSEQETRLDYECTNAALYLVGRALLLQSRGDNKHALDELVTALKLSRHTRSKVTMRYYFWGLAAEGYALIGLDRWLERLGPEPVLLQQAIDELTRHENTLPPFSDSLKVEYLNRRNLFRQGKLDWNPFDLEMWVVGGGSIFKPETEWAMIANTPWERRHFERIMNLLFAGWLRACEADYSRILEQDMEIRNGEIPRSWLGEWLPPTDCPGSAMTPDDVAKFMWLWPVRGVGLDARNQARFGWTCGLRATRLKLILALYQLKEKRPAPSLEALVPEYMLEVPIDPYSGKPFRYRVSKGENITEQFFEEDRLRFSPEPKERIRHIPAGQGILWSVGLDGIDNGGAKHGESLDPAEWISEGFDQIFVVPRNGRKTKAFQRPGHSPTPTRFWPGRAVFKSQC
jgi:hypothetical protein